MCRLTLLTLALLGACGSKITSVIDTDLQKRANTVQDCFPGLFAKAQVVLDVANTWRLNSGASIPDPSGLGWSEQPDGAIDVSYVVSGCTLAMTISFYSPTGVLQNLDLSGAVTLADAVDLAATELRTLFGSAANFMVGEWSLTGSGVSGSGALTGMLGGSGDQNVLEELRTTVASPAAPPSGPPANANSTVTDIGPPLCMLTFGTASLATDDYQGQTYPVGTIDLAIAGHEATVTAAITFDGSVRATLVVSDVPGYFDFNLGTSSLTHRP
ncbi:MAG: hypothetical protein ABIP94_04375 [Planctomycetota bacterium]